jgi:tetratricopeptide (TPR) repeat protein
MKEGNLGWRPGNAGIGERARVKTKGDRQDMAWLNATNRKNAGRRQKILHNNQTVLIRRGLIALENGNTRLARFHFEEASGYERTPVVLSCLGYCLAREEKDMEKAFALCLEAVRREPGNPLHHLHLGRVYLIAGEKELAVTAFLTGLNFGEHPELLAELKRMGMRRPPLFTFLSRRHRLNKCCGFLLTRLGLRFLLHPMEITQGQS